MRSLKLLSVSQHNLKGFDLELPFYNLIVVTGVSGSGKSSLVFDTLYAEGQRRYLETFSSYVRQYFERLPRPQVKDILNIPPALAFPQGNFIRTSRSTVATLTEISHFAKMLYYHASVPKCPKCGIEIKLKDPLSIAREVVEAFEGQKLYLIAVKELKGDFEHLRDGMLSAGYSRIFLGDRVCDVEEVEDFSGREVEIVVYRTKATSKELSAIASAVEEAFKISGIFKVRTLYGEERVWIKRDACPECGWEPPQKNPNLFSFNSSIGACPKCNGFGNLLVVDFQALVRHPERSIREGAIPLLDYPFLTEVKIDLYDFLKEKGINLSTPFHRLPEGIKQAIFYGEGKWYGLKEVVDWLEKKRYKGHIRILLSKLRREVACPYCKGTRFNPKALSFYYQGLNIGEFYALEVKELRNFLEERRKAVLKERAYFRAEERLLEEILRRLFYLEEVGLDYLTLSRASKTLSSGEASRCLLTRALSSDLSETLYLIDEPTTGLHPRDTQRILKFMERLVEKRNTVVVVEHDPEVVLKADFLVDLGPGGGKEGGFLLHAGPPEGLLKKNTPTARALSRLKTRRALHTEPLKNTKFYRFSGIKRHNLKGFNLEIPSQAITCIVGPSGSGKSSLLEEIFERLEEKYIPVNFLKQEPLAKSPRSVVMSYLGIYPFIRKLFASTKEAKELGLPEGAFSFNSETYQCPACKGLGYEVVEMQFLSDVCLPCEVCKGKRFRKEVLQVRWRGKSIWDVFECTVNEALELFKGHPLIRKPLEILSSLGLGYLTLGQPLSTLSGGEAQRLRIAAILLQSPEKSVVLMDEPTVGLHLEDVKSLINTLKTLKEKGYTVILVEHHPEIMLSSDWIIELGPEGGEKGGYLIFEGELAGFLKEKTFTASYLFEYLLPREISSSSSSRERRYNYEESAIVLRGVNHHNLQNLELKIPRNRFVVITGVSGSGKSTLAFDVIFSEGQRRFLETLPAYLRQFVKLHEEVEYESISGIPPTVALEQKSGELSSRATVGTLTDILSYLRLLYARLSQGFCPGCGLPLKKRTEEELKELALSFLKERVKKGEKIKIFAPLVKHRKGIYRTLFERYLKKGEHFFRIDGEPVKIPPIPYLSRYVEHNIELFLGEVSPDEEKERFVSLFMRGLKEGRGEVIVSSSSGEYTFSTERVCPCCGRSLPEPDPLLFAFNSKIGACPFCGGLGCDECKGSRYRKEVFFYKIKDISLPELLDFPISKAIEFFEKLEFEERERPIGEPLRLEILKRLKCLKELGLEYLTLSRSADTLSSGEAKRVRIAQAIGSNLTGVAYVLDEPTIGLHPRDTERLIGVLKRLRDKGNTVIVIEHDEETILSADYLVELGPGGGRKGGKVLFAGELEEFLEKGEGPTFSALTDPERRKVYSETKEFEKFITLKQVDYRNLKKIDVKIPRGALVVVVGVSGSGKSSLICEVLYEGLKAVLSGRKSRFMGVKKILGAEGIKRVYLVDHSPIGNTPRSTPATYMGVYTDIRKAFAETLMAKAKGYKEGHFSFNTQEGQCPYCKGQGYTKVEVKFLPAVYQACEYCQGKRYRKEVLEVKVNGKDISEVLEMSFEEAREFFRNFPSIFRKLDVVCNIGLEYLTLGQPSPTLSGGEAQRIKLAKEFVKSSKSEAVFILDEPTTGLHIKDVEKLVKILSGLVEKGHTVVVIEHNFELIKHADWIIELGPEGGEKGGYLLFEGLLRDFLKQSTPTAKAFKKYLKLA